MPMTGNNARKYFADAGLVYSDINIEKLNVLHMMLNAAFSEENISMVPREWYWIRVNDAKLYKGKYDEQGRMLYAFLTVKGRYFDAREVISFNGDGFIGFCGAASERNQSPVMIAFQRWCDWLKSNKDSAVPF